MLTINKEVAMRAYPVIHSLSYLFKKYKELAAEVAINETINFSEKLAPFINPEYQMQKEVIVCLEEVLTQDAYNCHILNKFVVKYGDLPVNGTTLKNEMLQVCHDLLELADDAHIV